MRLSKLFVNRLLLAFGLVRGLIIVWHQLNPDLFTFSLIASLGVFFTLLADESLRKLDKHLDKPAKLFAIPVYLVLVVTLLPQYAIPLIVSIRFNIGLGESKENLIVRVPTELVATTESLESIDFTNSLKRGYLGLPANFLSRRHGAYQLHPVTSSLLYYS